MYEMDIQKIFIIYLELKDAKQKRIQVRKGSLPQKNSIYFKSMKQ